MLGEQKGAVRSEMVSERKDLSYVAVCQERQLRGICLESLVIVESVLEATVL